MAQIDPAVLHTLVRKSLLHKQNGRFTLHVLIRQFAQEHLPADTGIYIQHGRYFSQQLRDAEPEALLVELDNIRAMWQTAVQNIEILADAAHNLARFYAVTNQFTEGCQWAERSVSVLRETDDEAALAFSLNLLGILHIQGGDYDTAVTLLTECADLYRRAAAPSHLLKPLINSGSVHMRLGHYDAAVTHLNEALPLAEQLGDLRGMAHIFNNLGAIYLILGDLEAAYEQFAACLPLTEETAYQPVRLVALQNLAEVSYKQGNWAQAIHHSEASLAVGYGAQALPALLDVLTGVGELLLVEGETAVALDLLQFIRAHPATEQQYVAEAEALLAQAGGEGTAVVPTDFMLEDVVIILDGR